MATRKCWNCGVVAHMTRVGNGVLVQTKDSATAQGTYRCDQCGYLQIAHAYRVRIDGDAGTIANTSLAREIASWHPVRGDGPAFDDVPEEIAEAATEAHRCWSIQAFRGASAIARAVIEASAKAKGITAGQLYTKIEALEAAGHIRKHITEAAHEIRHLGNDVAHGDFAEPVLEEEAAEILALMGEVLQEVFQSPARVARVRAAREAKKASGSI